ASRLPCPGETSASAWSARASTAASAKPGSRSIGTSLSECTAMSASPRCIASSSSLRNRPLPPRSASERSRISSPRVLSGTSATSSPGWASRRRAATCSVCHSASGLLRVAMRRRAMRALSPERAPQGTQATARDLQRLVAVAQDREGPALRVAPQLDQLVARDQAVAVDTHEAVAELFFQRLQRFLDQVLAVRVVHDHVLLFGL